MKQIEKELVKPDKMNKVLSLSSVLLYTIRRKLIIGIAHSNAGKNTLVIGNSSMLSHNRRLHHSLTIDDRSQASLPRSKTDTVGDRTKVKLRDCRRL